jgi:hypothetical protein
MASTEKKDNAPKCSGGNYCRSVRTDKRFSFVATGERDAVRVAQYCSSNAGLSSGVLRFMVTLDRRLATPCAALIPPRPAWSRLRLGKCKLKFPEHAARSEGSSGSSLAARTSTTTRTSPDNQIIHAHTQ